MKGSSSPEKAGRRFELRQRRLSDFGTAVVQVSKPVRIGTAFRFGFLYLLLLSLSIACPSEAIIRRWDKRRKLAEDKMREDKEMSLEISSQGIHNILSLALQESIRLLD